MNNLVLYNAKVIKEDKIIDGGFVHIEGKKIKQVGYGDVNHQINAKKIDVKGNCLSPGFIDIHTHGGFGVTFGTGDLEKELNKYSKWVATTGVTGFLVTLILPDIQSLSAVVSHYAEVLEKKYEGATPLGLHLEGPFISKEKKGAFNPDWILEPDLEAMKEMIRVGNGWIKQVTLAPELKGSYEIAMLLRKSGIVASLGHTNGDYDSTLKAIKGPYSHVTHTYNAQRAFSHRDPGVVGAVLNSEEVTTELIADFIHVHPGAIQLLINSVGMDRVVLITDAMAGAGLQDGNYSIMDAKVKINVENGVARLPNGTLAGSSVTIEKCIRNIKMLGNYKFNQIINMASINPSKAMGFNKSIGSIVVQKKANLVAFDEKINILFSVIEGEIKTNSL